MAGHYGATASQSYGGKIKDKKIVLYRVEYGQDSIGNPVPVSYTPIHPGRIWAYTRQLSMNETAEHGVDVDTEERLFRVNYRKGLTQELLIEYCGKWYNVWRVDDYEGNRRDITLYASRNSLKREPDPSLVKPYGGDGL